MLYFSTQVIGLKQQDPVDLDRTNTISSVLDCEMKCKIWHAPLMCLQLCSYKPFLNVQPLVGLEKGQLGSCKRAATMEVQLDPLDGLDDTMLSCQSRPLAHKYWCYIQCSKCDRGWIWRRNLGKGADWTLNCYWCGSQWRRSFEDNGGWFYWDPVRKRREGS